MKKRAFSIIVARLGRSGRVLGRSASMHFDTSFPLHHNEKVLNHNHDYCDRNCDRECDHERDFGTIRHNDERELGHFIFKLIEIYDSSTGGEIKPISANSTMAYVSFNCDFHDGDRLLMPMEYYIRKTKYCFNCFLNLRNVFYS